MIKPTFNFKELLDFYYDSIIQQFALDFEPTSCKLQLIYNMGGRRFGFNKSQTRRMIMTLIDHGYPIILRPSKTGLMLPAKLQTKLTTEETPC